MKATPVSGKFRFPFILAVLTGAAACSNTGAHASAYIIEQLTSNNYADRNPQINDSGYVVWSGFDAEGSDLEIMLYDGSMISPLTDNDVHDMYPKINNANHVVWQGYDSAGSDTEIFLYNGSATVSITANDYRDDLPQINNNGYVTWKAGYACNLGPCEIFLFDGITSKPISGDDLMVSAPRINDAGQVVWHGGQDCWFDLLFLDDCDIYLYDGSMVDPSPINNSAGLDWNPDINDSGHVVYKKIGYGIDLVVPGIYLYDGTAAEPISSSASSRPQINDSGQVVWSGYGDGDSDLEIFLYQGPSADPIKITVNIRDDKGPRINNKGQVAWYGYDSSGSDYEIYVFDGTSINPSPITNDSHDDLYPEINSDGCVVWQGWDGNDLEIYYACPAPSFDIAQADIFEFPWWKSEEYWGGDSRLTILPPYLDAPEINPEPLPCPECSFSAEWRPEDSPSGLILLYQSKNLLFATDSTEFQRKYIEHMMELFKAIPTGLRYDETLKASVVKALFELKPAAGMHRETATVAGEVARALNAIELDWRVPLLKPVRLDTVKNATVDFEGIARVTFTDSIEAGEILLTVENDLPALVAGYDPGWPLASYRFEYTGMLNRYANIDIFFGGRVFEGDLSSLRLYQWEGKNYRDITTRVDLPARTIRGRTDRFSPLVIMNAVDGRRKLK